MIKKWEMGAVVYHSNLLRASKSSEEKEGGERRVESSFEARISQRSSRDKENGSSSASSRFFGCEDKSSVSLTSLSSSKCSKITWMEPPFAKVKVKRERIRSLNSETIFWAKSFHFSQSQREII